MILRCLFLKAMWVLSSEVKPQFLNLSLAYPLARKLLLQLSAGVMPPWYLKKHYVDFEGFFH